MQHNNKYNYKLAAFTALLSALVIVPTSVVNFVSFFKPSDTIVAWNTVLSCFLTIITFALLWFFHAHLKQRLNPKNLTFWISYLIVSIVLLNTLGMIFPYLDDTFFMPVIAAQAVLMILCGIGYIKIGYTIIKLEANKKSHLKNVGISSMIIGILLASVLFASLSVIVSIVMDIFLILMFLKESRPEPLPVQS